VEVQRILIGGSATDSDWSESMENNKTESGKFKGETVCVNLHFPKR
jgi:hypothetical protein